MPKFEQFTMGENKPNNTEKEVADLRQILAQKDYEISMSDEAERLGPPNPENYEQAEKIMNNLIDLAATESNWIVAVNILRRGFSIMKMPSDIIYTMLGSIERYYSNSQEREPFLKSLKEEALKYLAEHKKLWTTNLFADKLDEFRAEAKALHSESDIEEQAK